MLKPNFGDMQAIYIAGRKVSMKTISVTTTKRLPTANHRKKSIRKHGKRKQKIVKPKTAQRKTIRASSKKLSTKQADVTKEITSEQIKRLQDCSDCQSKPEVFIRAKQGTVGVCKHHWDELSETDVVWGISDCSLPVSNDM